MVLKFWKGRRDQRWMGWGMGRDGWWMTRGGREVSEIFLGKFSE